MKWIGAIVRWIWQRLFGKPTWWDRYNRYLRSPKWRKLRRRVLERCHYRCERCRKAKATEVHHKTYARMGDELLSDLMGVCRKCHRAIHEQ